MKRFFIIALIVLLSISSAAAENENSEFTELQHVFAAAKPLINNEDDRQKLSDAVEIIMQLSKMPVKEEKYAYVYASVDEMQRFSVRKTGGRYKVPLVISSKRRSTCELKISTLIFL